MNIDDSLSLFDISSIYPSAMSLKHSFYPKTETVYVSTKHMKDTLVKLFRRKECRVENTKDIIAIWEILKLK